MVATGNLPFALPPSKRRLSGPCRLKTERSEKGRTKKDRAPRSDPFYLPAPPPLFSDGGGASEGAVHSGSISPYRPSRRRYTTLTRLVSALEKTKKLCPNMSICRIASSTSIGFRLNRLILTTSGASSSTSASPLWASGSFHCERRPPS